MTWIETIGRDDATGALKEAYEQYLQKTGAEEMPEILKTFSLSPGAYGPHYDYYQQIAFGKGPLKRYQREMIATHVSNINECHY